MAICTYCKKKFVPCKKGKGKYCSRECSYADHRENGRPELRKHKDIVCDCCGKVYTPKKFKKQYDKHYCSLECQRKAMNKNEPVECPICKKVFTPTSDRLKYCSYECSWAGSRKYTNKAEQKRAEKDRWKARHKDELEAKAAARAVVREAKRAERQQKKLEEEQQKKQKDLEKILARMHECPICGAITDRPKYCSDVCANKAINRRHEVRRRHKLHENGEVDYSITLEALILRDKNICHICGGQCDLTDCETVDGTFIAGNMYPSVDHVIAVANGGLHQWGNVRLAHRICNSNKNAEIAYVTEGGQLRLWT